MANFTTSNLHSQGFKFRGNTSVHNPFGKGHLFGAFHVENLYMSCFGLMPNELFIGLHKPKVREWIRQEYHSEIKGIRYVKRHQSSGEGTICFQLFDDVLLCFDPFNNGLLMYTQTDEGKIDAFIQSLNPFRKRRRAPNTSNISILKYEHGFLDTEDIKITKPKLDLSDNYNDDFMETHRIILSRLSKKNDKGLILLHGKPGTGKTSYIRYLANKLKKQIILLPQSLAPQIASPAFTDFLISHSNSIFIIEDAENIIIDRGQTENSAVSVLLNIADGLLSDCLNIQLICTFNTDISKVDSALLRKGRLIAKYDFRELETEKAQTLSNKLGFSSIVSSPMTLTDIYNQNDQHFAPIQRARIGFSSKAQAVS